MIFGFDNTLPGLLAFIGVSIVLSGISLALLLAVIAFIAKKYQ